MSNEINGLEGLKQLHPVFEFRNRTQSQQEIRLDNGDTMLIQPGAVGKCQSSLFNQLPELSKFEYIKPSTQDLITANVITTTQEATPVPPATVETAKVVASKDTQKGGQPLKSQAESNS